MTNMKSLVGLTLLGLALPASATTLFFAGDSTLDDNGLSLGGRIRAPYYSWGTQLQKAIKTGDRVRWIEVTQFAVRFNNTPLSFSEEFR